MLRWVQLTVRGSTHTLEICREYKEDRVPNKLAGRPFEACTTTRFSKKRIPRFFQPFFRFQACGYASEFSDSSLEPTRLATAEAPGDIPNAWRVPEVNTHGTMLPKLAPETIVLIGGERFLFIIGS